MRTTLNYSSPAELFYNGNPKSSRKLVYRRFPTAAEAICFAVETVGFAAGFTTLQVDEDRFGRDEIRRLYDDPHYPLSRKIAA